MDPGKIFQIITNSTLLATRLVSGSMALQFTEPLYCLLLAEDAPPDTKIITVQATHINGAEVRYSITEGNKDGLFTIHQRTGLITTAAHLDYELQSKHELVVRAESKDELGHTKVQVTVVDVNDNPPVFKHENPIVFITEEDDSDLPAIIFKVEADDRDSVDKGGLVYSIGGDGVDGLIHQQAFFTINPHTGDIMQLRAVDRDPPNGRSVWKVKVQVRDGQWVSPSLAAAATRASRKPRFSSQHKDKIETRISKTSMTTPTNCTLKECQYSRENQSVDTMHNSTPFSQQKQQNVTKISSNLHNSGSKSSTDEIYVKSKNPPWFRGVNKNGRKQLALSMVTFSLYKGSKPSYGLNKGLDPRNIEKPHQETYIKIARENSPQITKNPPYIKTVLTNDKRKEGNSHDEMNIDTIQMDQPYIKKARENGPQITKNPPYIKTVLTNDKRKISGNSRVEMNINTSQMDQPYPKILHEKREYPKILYERREHVRRFSPKGGFCPILSSFSNDLKLEYGEDYRTQNGAQNKKGVRGQRDWEKDESKHEVGKNKIEENIKRREEGHRNMSKRGGKEREMDWKREEEREEDKNKARRDNTERLKTEENKEIKSKYRLKDRERNGGKMRIENAKDEMKGNKKEHENSEGDEKGDIGKEKGNEEENNKGNEKGNEVKGTGEVMYLSNERGNDDQDNIENEKGRERKSERDENEDKERENDKETDMGNEKRNEETSEDEINDSNERRDDEEEDDRMTDENEEEDDIETDENEESGNEALEKMMREMRLGNVHVSETVIIVIVRDINDNKPVFPNSTIYGEVQENGPIDLSAGMVWAWDADDQDNSTYGRLTYSIQDNIVDRKTGQDIFTINPESGIVSTSVCCLDRETTPEYSIRVAAVDGGGLKGSGTMLIRLVDVNDNSPRLIRPKWKIEVDETWGNDHPSNTTLLHISTTDHDTTNYFYYRVVEGSGWGWEHFGMRTVGSVGQLYAIKTLDYEDTQQRKGFKFMVQVTDRGRGGWGDDRHMDTGWVEVTLKDRNDNPPIFTHPHAHITVTEDAPPGSILASLSATDLDQDGQQNIRYSIRGGWNALRVDTVGGVSLWRTLDRDKAGGDKTIAKIIAKDNGNPQMSSTATLTITLTDVNDSPPRLLPPTTLNLTEGVSGRLLGVLTATDDDLWGLGNGPPFRFMLAPSNPYFVTSAISIVYHKDMDSGRGGAEVWSLGPVDREEHSQISVGIKVQDSKGLFAINLITIIIDDVNDNPMKPGAKTVHLWKTQGGGAEVALGRVYVEDPDDWDLQDKTFRWAGPPHSQFTLNENTGDIHAYTQLRDERYELHFLVSDRTWGQNVGANVTIRVHHLSPEALSHAVPITFTSISPTALANGWTPNRGGGGLGNLTQVVKKVLGENKVQIVSVYGTSTHPKSLSTNSPSHSTHSTHPPQPMSVGACVWVSVSDREGRFWDPTKLRGLLSLNTKKIEEAMKLSIVIDDTGLAESEENEESKSVPYSPSSSESHSSLTSLASVILPFQVVDTNLTSLVTPRLTRAPYVCHTNTNIHDTCTPRSCLNGGRCLRTHTGDRCVCPGSSWGPQCKILSRSFYGSGFAWLRPLRPCLPITLSLKILPRSPDGIILYSGLLSPPSAHPHTSAHPLPTSAHPPTSLLAVQMVKGKMRAVLDGPMGPMNLNLNGSLELDVWHTLHLHLNAQGVTLVLDMCDEKDKTDCMAHTKWPNSNAPERWVSSNPLQLGGIASQPFHRANFGWTTLLHKKGFTGCISHFRVGSEDLGEPAYISGSKAGCSSQDVACGDRISCGHRGICVGGLRNPKCECPLGFEGLKCNTQVLPASFGALSFAKIRLLRPPDPLHTSLQLRVRTRGRTDGLLAQLTSSKSSQLLRLQLRGGVACAYVTNGVSKNIISEVCLTSFPLTDGLWHALTLKRDNDNLILAADDGDMWRYNETLPLITVQNNINREVEGQEIDRRAKDSLKIDGLEERMKDKIGGKREGVERKKVLKGVEDGLEKDELLIGGVGKVLRTSEMIVDDDLKDACMDDLRVSGLPLPLPPISSNNKWGEVITMQNLQSDCPSHNPCLNSTCLPPLTCHNTWRSAVCSCGSGKQLRGLVCEDIDECIFDPCLNGGTCHNLRPGYTCSCPHSTMGLNCEYPNLVATSNPTTAHVAIAALTLSILLLVVVGLVVRARLQRWRTGRDANLGPRITSDTEGIDTSTSIQALTHTPYTHTDNRQIFPLDLPQISTEKTGLSEACLSVPVTLKIPPTLNNDEQEKSDQSISCKKVKKMVCCVESLVMISESTEGQGLKHQQGSYEATLKHPTPTLDDLRAYAYEGNCSPSSSLVSPVLESQTDSEADNIQPECREVLDLIKNLPDAVLHISSVTQSNLETNTPMSQTDENLGTRTMNGTESQILEN